MTDPTPESGRELDRWIAAEVEGWTIPSLVPDLVCAACGERPCDCAPPYSTDIAAAWPVLDALEDRPTPILSNLTRKLSSESGSKIIWEVVLRECHYPWRRWHAEADTAPLAICRCALKAVRADTEGEGQ